MIQKNHQSMKDLRDKGSGGVSVITEEVALNGRQPTLV